MSPPIAVFGGSSQTGRHVITELARRGLHARALVRSEASAEVARQAGANDTALIDLDDRNSLAAALTDCDTVVYIAPPFDAAEEAHVIEALDLATTLHIGHFVYYSVLHANMPDMPHHVRKLQAEGRVRRSSVGWTIVQPTMYQQSLLRFVRATDDGVVRVPFGSTTSFQLVDLGDVGEVIGSVCAAPNDHVYSSYELAGPERLNVDEMIQRVGDATGREFRVETLSPLRFPLPPHMPVRVTIEMLAMFAHYDESGYPGNPNVLRHLLGREPTSLAATAKREL